MGHFLTDMSNRVEHQKQNQPAIEKWPFGFVFGVQLGLRQPPAVIKNVKNTKKQKNTCSSLLLILRALNQCRCLPKAELNTKTNPNGHHSVAVWVRFGVQLDYSCRLKSVPSNVINRARRTRFTASDGTLFNRLE